MAACNLFYTLMDKSFDVQNIGIVNKTVADTSYDVSGYVIKLQVLIDTIDNN